MDHYNGKEFEKLLEEAQANIMKSIPNLEMPPASGPQPKGDAPADKLEFSGKVLKLLAAPSQCAVTPLSTCWPVEPVSHFLRVLGNFYTGRTNPQVPRFSLLLFNYKQ